MNEPLWGWPWHGRVDKDGLLHLPNGETMAYYSPLSQSNNTYRVKVPGVAPISRTPAELAADTARGMEWRNEAVMHAYTLCRRDLGGWIYCAPDGSRWIIRLNVNVSGTSNNPEAVRFGVLGGKPETQPLSVSWPTDDLIAGSELVIEGPPYLVRRSRLPVDISPEGSRAIYMLYVGDQNFATDERPIPVGFQLVTVSGERGAISVNVTTLRTMEQTLGETVYEDLRVREERTNRQTIPLQGGTVRMLAPDRLKSDDPPGTVYATGDLQTGFEYIKSVGTMASYLNGRILALWFNPAGDIIECSLDYRTDLAVDFPEYEPTSTGNPDRDRWARIVQRTHREQHALRVDGVEVYTFSREEWALTDTFNLPVGTYRQEYELTFDDGRHEFREYFDDSMLTESPLAPLTAGQRLYAGNQWRLLSNNIAVLFRAFRDENDIDRLQYRGCATPWGVVQMGGDAAGVTTTTQPLGPLTGACFNPFNGEVSDPAGDTMTFV